MYSSKSNFMAASLCLLIGITHVAQADWFFRGTSNAWAAAPLTQVTPNTFEICQSFSGNDAAGGPRFKIDRLGNWSESYPTADYAVGANSSYKITFNSSTKAIATQVVSSCNLSGFNKVFSTLNLRGTFNNWGNTAMTLVAHNTWQVTVTLNGQANQRFKFDVQGDWSKNYGDTNSDRYLEQSGADIYQTGSGSYRITVNDQSKLYAIEPMACTQNCSVTVNRLGAVYSPTATVFSLWSPDTSNVKVKVNGVVEAMPKVADFNGYSDIYQVKIPGDLHLAEYTFIVNGVEVRDPYGVMAKPQSNINIVLDLARTNPTPSAIAAPLLVAREDAIIYEMHMRDFTIDPSSGVSAIKRGKFLGAVETGKTYNGAKTGIDHLKELGVTHVQLLPVYDFSTCDGLPDSDACYNWGYDPRNFNVPEDRYSQTPLDYENRAREFKIMVNEFHKAGIRVIMDVVYNHTFAKEMFNNITPKYYTATDLSGTGNSIDADQPMVSRMIQDSLEFWVDEYGVDGFRFDLIGVFSYAEVKKWGKNLNNKYSTRNLLLYGEPWNGYATDAKESQRVRYGTTRFMADEHIGVFNGAFREAIKGNNDGTATGYMFNNLAAADSGWSIFDGMRASPYNATDSRNGTWFRNFSADPEQTINYISAHDNFGLWDKIYLSLASNVVQDASHQVLSFTPPTNLGYAKRVANFGMGIVLTSQGIPFINAGDEFLRTKTNNEQINQPAAWNYGAHGGTHNSYNAPDSFNSIKWQNKINNAATTKYVKEMVALRRAHSGLRMKTNADISQYMTVARPAEFGGEVVTAYITAPQDTHKLFVVYNSGNNRYLNLPAGTWTQVANTNGATNVTGLSAMALVEGTAVSVFSQPK
jgi:pullulanase